MPKPPGAPSTNVQELIIRARGGSREALGELLAHSRQYLLLIANEEFPKDLRERCGPSDVVQMTHVEAVREFARFQGETEQELLGWLREMLLNNVRDVTRHHLAAKRRSDREVPLADSASGSGVAGGLVADQSSPSSHLQREEQTQRIEAAVKQLPALYRQVLEMRNREGLSFDEIGKRLGRSAAAARQLWVRAIKKLQGPLGLSREQLQ